MISSRTLARVLVGSLALSVISVASAQEGTFPPAGGQRQPGQGQAPGQAPGQGQGQRGGGDPAVLVQRMMSQDANGDGKLSRDELPEAQAARMFDRGDTNKDGFLEIAEIEVIAKEGAMRGGQGGQGGQGGPGQGGPGGQGGQGGRAPANFESSMKQANGGYKALAASKLDASSLNQDLDAVQRLQMGLVGSKAGIANVPMSPAAKAKYGEDMAGYTKAFRKTILDAVSVTVALEMSILEGNTAASKALLTKLHDSEESGHKLFQVEEAEGAEGAEGAAAPTAPREGRGGRRQREQGAPAAPATPAAPGN